MHCIIIASTNLNRIHMICTTFIGAAIVSLFGIIATAAVFVIFAYRRYKVHHRNQETSQGSCHVQSTIRIIILLILLPCLIQLFTKSHTTGLYLDYHIRSQQWNSVLHMEC